MEEAPRDYAAWVRILDRFRDGDDSTLDLMRCGSVEWSAVVAERWTRHVSQTLGARLTRLSTRLQTGLDRARNDSFQVSRALLDARRALRPLRVFASTSSFPENVREHLASEVRRWAEATQEGLERGARAIRTDEGRLLKTVRDTSLTATDTDPGAAPAGSSVNQPRPPGSGRRVIL